jgi:serine/threonine-protein kinase
MATTVHTSGKSREDRVKGNVAYMAPEQAKADYKLDARADIFALGVILWELLAGKRFWEGVSEVDVLAKLGDDSPMPAPRTVVSALPEPLDKLCADAIHKVRDERTESVAQFLEQFKDVVKKTSLKATAEEVGEFVTSLFDDERTKMRAIVEEARLEASGEEKKPLPAVGAPPTSSANPLVDKESDPRLRFGIATPDEEPPKRIIEVIVAETPPSADRRFGYMMAAAAVAVLGGIAIYAVTHPGEEKKIEEKPYEPPVRPTATTTATESAAVEEPEEVTIDISVSTPQAKLFVDGVAVSNPYRTRVVPAQFPHAIRAEAEGYETRTMSVTFDKERSIELALTPAKRKP